MEPATLNITTIHSCLLQQYSCRYNEKNVGAKMSGIVYIKKGSESDLLSAVANVGPVAVAVDGTSSAFRVSTDTCICL